MKKLKIKNKYLRGVLKGMVIAVISLFIINIFEFFDLLPDAVIAGLKVLIIILALFISAYGLIEGNTKKGWLVGIKLALIYIVIVLCCNFLLFNQGFSLKLLLYFCLIMLACILGAMIGVFRKQEPSLD